MVTHVAATMLRAHNLGRGLRHALHPVSIAEGGTFERHGPRTGRLADMNRHKRRMRSRLQRRLGCIATERTAGQRQEPRKQQGPRTPTWQLGVPLPVAGAAKVRAGELGVQAQRGPL